MNPRTALLIALVSSAGLALNACEKKPATNDPKPAAAGPKADDHTHAPGDSHDGHDHADEGQHGTPIALGEAAIGSFKAVASRDDVPFKAGGDAPIDVVIDAAAAGTAKVEAVRFWIGVEDASGSIKAKADIEDPKQPNHWHTHAEVPDPLPAGAKLWVEIEDDAGKMHRGSFELKQ